MIKKFIPVSRPFIDKSDVNFVRKFCLEKGLIGPSKIISNFENVISNDLKMKFAVATNSGTSALITAVAALQLPKNSKILIPNSTIISVLNAVILNNHKPIFCDVDVNDWNISLDEVKRLCNKHKISACILVENFNSASKEHSSIISFLKKNKIKIIEDASESFGGKFKNKHFGTFGDITTLSFYPNKLISTGEGGMILTNKKIFYEYSKSYINLFFNENRNFKHQKLGFNFRINSMSAALGLSQYKKKNKFLAHRKKLYEKYLNDIDWKFYETQKIHSFIETSYWVFPLIIKYKNFRSKDILKYLISKNIQSRHLFFPLSQQPLIQNKQKLKNSLYIYDHGFYVPLGNGIKISEVEQVIRVLNNFFKIY